MKVIAYKFMPARSPLLLIAVWWLLLDRLRAPGWVWGATGLFLFFCVVVWVVSLWTQKQCTPMFIGEERK